MAIIRETFILREDLWFDEKPEESPEVDVLYYYYQPTPPPFPDIEFDEEYTLLLDLRQDQDQLWKSLKKENRYKIRKAEEKDRVTYKFWDCIDSDRINDFCNFYKEFTAHQGLRNLNKQAISRLKNYADAGVLNISCVKSKEGNPLTWRVYYYSRNRVFPLHSASVRHDGDASYNQMLGRAHRYHRWQDILKFKSLGTLTYDLGGLYRNTTNPKLLNVNSFKEELGGELVKNFHWRHGLTLKGKLFLLVRKMLVSPP